MLGVWRTTYTGNGDVAQTSGPRSGAFDTVTQSYDVGGRLEEMVTSRIEANSDGSGVHQSDAAVTDYSHDYFGNLTSVNDPNGNTTTYNYDAIGQLLSKNTAGLRAESFLYEPGGQVSQYTNPLGGITRKFYTSTGKIRRQENPDGSVLEWRYYTDGRVYKEILRNGSFWLSSYDDANHKVTRTLTKPDGSTVLATEVNVFDSRGNLLTHTDPEGGATSYTYDGLNRVKTVTGPSATPGGAQQIVTNIYGSSSKTFTTRNALGETTVTTSDAIGRPLTVDVQDSAGASVRRSSYSYSSDHQSVTLTSGTGVGAVNQTTYSDPAGKPLLSIDGASKVTRYTYDSNGNLLSTTDPLNQTTHWTYNGLDQVSTQTLPDSNLTTFTHDAAGHLTLRAMAGGLNAEELYDNAGRVTSSRLYNGATVSRSFAYAYYPSASPWVGLLQTTTAPRDTITTTYDDYLRPSTVTTTGAVAETNGTVTYGYDKRGLVTSIAQGSTANAAGPATTINRGYDGYGQLTSESLVVGGSAYSAVTQTWDAAGRRASLNEAGSTLPAPLFGYQYQADGHLTHVSSNLQDYAFSYSDSGLLTARTNAFRVLSVDSRDSVGRILRQTTAVAGTTAMAENMTWRENGSLSNYGLSRAAAWDENRNYTYNDGRHWITSEGYSPAMGQAPLLKYVFDNNSTGGLGVRTSTSVSGTQDGQASAISTVTSIDGLSRVTLDQNDPLLHLVPVSGVSLGADHVDVFVDGVSKGRAQYPGWADNVGAWSMSLFLTPGAHTLTANAVHPSGKYTATATSTFTVDAPSAVEGSVASVYDDEGNVISRTLSSGAVQTLTWDAFNRLIKVAQRDGSGNGYDWIAVYDGLGRRLKTSQQLIAGNVATGSPTVISSIFDPQVEFLEIGVAINGAKAWKVYGPDLNALFGGLQGTGGLEATILDADGTTKGVINDAFGNGVASVTGSSVTWFPTRVGAYGPLLDIRAEVLTDITRVAEATAWRGRRLDPTGFYNLGARYYEPTTGRFLSPDPMGHAASMSLYDFANGDPVNNFDPDGRCSDNNTAHFTGFPNSFNLSDYIVRKEYGDLVDDVLTNGYQKLNNEFSLADTALNQGRGYYPASTTAGGAPNIDGKPLWLDITDIQSSGGNIYSNEAIVADMRAQGIPEARINMYIQRQALGEGEVLVDAIPASSINTGSMMALTRTTQGLGIVGAGVTGWNLGQSINRSIDQGTPTPVIAQTVREAGGWGGAWLGFQTVGSVAALAGVETGPGALVTGLIGGVVGGYYGYKAGNAAGASIENGGH